MEGEGERDRDTERERGRERERRNRENPKVLQIFNVYEDDFHLHMIVELCDALLSLYDHLTHHVFSEIVELCDASSSLCHRLTHCVFSESEATTVMLSLLEAIAYCHNFGVVHRDIKSDNILFDSWNRLKLADFRSADCFHEGKSLKGLVGILYYVAPEVIYGRRCNEKGDVWSAGVILYIMLSGTTSFYGENAVEIFEYVLRGNLRFPTRIFHSVSASTKYLLRKMLCKDVSKRFSVEQLLWHPWIVNGGEARAMT